MSRSSVHGGLALAAIVMLAACSSNASNPMIPTSPSQPAASVHGAAISGRYVAPAPGPWALTRLCGQPSDPRDRRCDAIQRNDVAMTMRPNGAPFGYSPADLQSAYGLAASSAAASTQTVAIVDAYDDPKAESDLAIYRSTFGLPPCTTANGCFRKVNQNGLSSPLPHKDAGWAGEESLDLDMVSAICPNCHILFVEANNAGNGLDKAVNTAVRLGANVVSNSYGGGEYAKSDPAFIHPGVVITAAAGDSGYYDCDPYPPYRSCTGPEQPASFPNVVAAGGTSLTRSSATARGWSESVWNDVIARNNDNGATGSGCSRLIPKPAWQTDTGCTMRSETDVSAVADPNTPVAVYDSFPRGGWGAYGGTSVASPLLAAVFALAGNAATVAQPAGLWGQQGANLNDVTVGNNLVPASVNRKTVVCPAAWQYICYAGVGYDGPTGWGTPNGIAAF